MVNTISIHISRIPYSHRDMVAPSAIRIAVDGDASTTELLSVEWDATPVVAWFKDNALAIQEEILPASFDNDGRSIAEKARIALDFVDPFDDSAVNDIYGYLHRHSIVFAFDGTIVPAILIGIGPNGGEISCFEPNAKWRYDVDLSQFRTHVDAVALELARV